MLVPLEDGTIEKQVTKANGLVVRMGEYVFSEKDKAARDWYPVI